VPDEVQPAEQRTVAGTLAAPCCRFPDPTPPPSHHTGSRLCLRDDHSAARFVPLCGYASQAKSSPGSRRRLIWRLNPNDSGPRRPHPVASRLGNGIVVTTMPF
jgi:hypothetical protein